MNVKILYCEALKSKGGTLLQWFGLKLFSSMSVLQVYIRIKDDEWNVYRRYAEFRSLHHKLQNKYQQVRTFNFPPKKAIGNKVIKITHSIGKKPFLHTPHTHRGGYDK